MRRTIFIYAFLGIAIAIGIIYFAVQMPFPNDPNPAIVRELLLWKWTMCVVAVVSSQAFFTGVYYFRKRSNSIPQSNVSLVAWVLGAIFTLAGTMGLWIVQLILDLQK